MIFGLPAATFTRLHVAISLVAILSGVVTVLAMVARRNLRAGTALFLAATVLTSLTGFFLPSEGFGPPQGVGVLSLAVLAIAIWARYGRRMTGVWRPTYIVAAVTALCLNGFVGVAQAFQKSPALATTGPEPPLVAAQLIVLALAVVLGFLAVRRFHPKPPPAA